MQNQTLRTLIARVHLTICTLFLGFVASAAIAATPANIAILTDGPSVQTDKIVRLMKNELNSLGGTEFEIRYPERLQANGHWSADAVDAALERLLANADTRIGGTV